MACLPPCATIDELERQVNERRAADPTLCDDHARAAVAQLFEHASWAALLEAFERRSILNRCDLETARACIERDRSWAITDLTGWCDHRHGAAPLNYMAMLRFDAPRLGLTNDLSATGPMARLLLAAGAPVNGNPGESETPLMTAASYGDADVARVLIAAGADLDCLAAPDAGGVAGGSALLHAAVFGMTDVLDALAEAGARVRSFVEAAAVGDVVGWPMDQATPEQRLLALIMAADHQRLDVIDALLDVGTPIDAADPEWHRQPLRLAAQNGRAHSVRRLLERGADPTLTDTDGRTALELCSPQQRYLPNPGHELVARCLAAVIASRP